MLLKRFPIVSFIFCKFFQYASVVKRNVILLSIVFHFYTENIYENTK